MVNSKILEENQTFEYQYSLINVDYKLGSEIDNDRIHELF